MQLNKSAVLFAIVSLAMQACATTQAPGYWMKKYPDAPHTKQLQCLAVADEAYEKAGGTQGRGDNGFAVLAKGTVWEVCMEGRK